MPSSNIKRKKKPGPANNAPNNGGGGGNFTETAMDEYLARLDLYRKPIAKDGSCLFRAVSEQVSLVALSLNGVESVECVRVFMSRICFLSARDSIERRVRNQIFRVDGPYSLIFKCVYFALIDVLFHNKQTIIWAGFSEHLLVLDNVL